MEEILAAFRREGLSEFVPGGGETIDLLDVEVNGKDGWSQTLESQRRLDIHLWGDRIRENCHEEVWLGYDPCAIGERREQYPKDQAHFGAITVGFSDALVGREANIIPSVYRSIRHLIPRFDVPFACAYDERLDEGYRNDVLLHSDTLSQRGPSVLYWWQYFRSDYFHAIAGDRLFLAAGAKVICLATGCEVRICDHPWDVDYGQVDALNERVAAARRRLS